MRASFLKIIGLTFFSIAAFWVLDALIDSRFHSDERFLRSLLFNRQEFASRGLFSVCFLAFGLFMAAALAREKKAEEKVRFASMKWRNTFDSISDLVSVHDTDFKILNANKALMQFTGMPYDELIGRTCYEVLHHAAGPVENCPHARAMNLREPVTEDIHDPETDTYQQVSCSPIWDLTGKLLGSVHLVRDITARKKAELMLRQALDEKNMLMKEIHHRVKNNLSVIQSLLNLQLRDTSDKLTKDSFLDIQNRVKSMSMIHDRLSRSGEFTHVNLSEYVTSLADQISQGYGVDSTKVRLAVSVPDKTLDVDAMMPLGLIVNELISNAFKHAFPGGREGSVTVAVSAGEDGMNTLVVSDDGIGMPDDLDVHTSGSLGLMLVRSLTSQLGGTLDISQESGTEFRITFPDRRPGH